MVSATREKTSSRIDTPGESAAAVYMKTPSMPLGSGFGATTNGWRPISVKIQPKIFARNGARMLATARRISHVDAGTVPFRVSHHASAQPPAAITPKPIMRRKPQ